MLAAQGRALPLEAKGANRTGMTGATDEERILGFRLEDVAQALLDLVHDVQEGRVQVPEQGQACQENITPGALSFHDGARAMLCAQEKLH